MLNSPYCVQSEGASPAQPQHPKTERGTGGVSLHSFLWWNLNPHLLTPPTPLANVLSLTFAARLILSLECQEMVIEDKGLFVLSTGMKECPRFRLFVLGVCSAPDTGYAPRVEWHWEQETGEGRRRQEAQGGGLENAEELSSRSSQFGRDRSFSSSIIRNVDNSVS